MVKKLGSCVSVLVLALLLAVPLMAAETETDMSKGGVTFSSSDGVNSLHIGGRMQFRYTGTDKEQGDSDKSGSGLGEEDGYSQKFEVKRMRLKLDGGMFRPWLKYEFQFEFGNTDGEEDNKIKDAVIEIEKSHLATLKLGQFKTPFSLQQLTSSGSQEFVDRAITDKKFAPGRDQGAMLSGVTESKHFGYQAGVFNGGGEAAPQDDQGLMYVGRVWWDVFGAYKPSESANDNPENHVLHFGLSARTGEAAKGSVDPNIFEDLDNETAMGFEAAWKWQRLFATGEYFMMTNQLDNPTSGDDVDSSGWNAQFGVMVVPKTQEVAVRYAQIDPDDDMDDDNVTETRLVYGYYWKKHNLKVQADVGAISYDKMYGSLSSIAKRNLPSLGTRLVSGKDLTDTELRVQMQVAF